MRQPHHSVPPAISAAAVAGEGFGGDRGGELPPISVVILAAEKDMSGLDACIRGVLAHSLNPVVLVQVVAQRLPPRSRNDVDSRVVWFDERQCATGSRNVRQYLRDSGRDPSTASWYFQQLAKMQCFDVLPAGAPEHVLVVDADFVFLRDMAFVDGQGRSVLPYGYPLSWRPNTREHRLPDHHTALESAGRLIPGWLPVDAYSGMQHHIVLDRAIVGELVQRAQDAHDMPFWQAFLRTADPRKWTGASEYVLYRHFAARFFPERVRHRHVDTVDVIQAEGPGGFALSEVVAAARDSSLHAVGCHRFLRYAERLATMDYIPVDLRRTVCAEPVPLQLRLDSGLLTMGRAVPPLTLD
ncbi:hypothetical protein TU94_27910 [Streptomyces cyaneogriseus subsp. noncyanogenus]|uniref:Nucleotide-diphospho-sugar transferase domain-containing protein n=1 Tax=Streptomyces cyaneogriseus subsp. noncyanogenus TaxID=477245 RepID=A0A0C5G3Z5_9ACTN|nr:DUF6492 family protein [Streptomyces cyaneogriseus]AJP04708.1 hypothetical protein TU94_27910 [Streptomyces cyaneogriseus subsp. noncyanogenus]